MHAQPLVVAHDVNDSSLKKYFESCPANQPKLSVEWGPYVGTPTFKLYLMDNNDLSNSSFPTQPGYVILEEAFWERSKHASGYEPYIGGGAFYSILDSKACAARGAPLNAGDSEEFQIGTNIEKKLAVKSLHGVIKYGHVFGVYRLSLQPAGGFEFYSFNDKERKQFVVKCAYNARR